MGKHWANVLADRIIEQFPEVTRYTCASGTSPSGIVHIGNFRDLITSDFVHRSLLSKGKSSRLLLSWDDYDRFRKVPAGVPENFKEFIGKPLTNVPDPKGELSSYAERFKKEYETAFAQVGIHPEIVSQTKEYASGRYDEQIKFALLHRKEIARVLARFKTQGMTEEEIEGYFPVNVYSRFTGKDTTRVESFDGESTLEYICNETGRKDKIDFTKDRVVKLPWRVDWPMRWAAEGVNFEPGGSDHATPGGSYDAGKAIAREIFNTKAPLFQGYAFIGISGAERKMSGSKGNAVSLGDILKIYEPEVVRWLFARMNPTQEFDISLGTEVIRVYHEWDGQSKIDDEVTQLSRVDQSKPIQQNPIPFRQAAGYGQIVSFDEDRFLQLLSASGERYNTASINSRLPRVNHWLTEFNKKDLIKLRESPNTAYHASLNEDTRRMVSRFKETILGFDGKPVSVEEIERAVYEVAKVPGEPMEKNKPRQKEFFRSVYQLLFDAERGPRLPTYIWANDKKKLAGLLTFNG